MYLTKPFFRLHGKELHQPPFKEKEGKKPTKNPNNLGTVLSVPKASIQQQTTKLSFNKVLLQQNYLLGANGFLVINNFFKYREKKVLIKELATHFLQ